MFGKLDCPTLLNGLGHALLIFDEADRLVLGNRCAQRLLGPDLDVIREAGWSAAAALFNTQCADPDEFVDNLRANARTAAEAVRFHIYRSGEYIPAWVSLVEDADGAAFTLLAFDTPDWMALRDLIDRFHSEVLDMSHATQGHLRLIMHSLQQQRPGDTVEQLSRRILGFTHLIGTHIQRMDLLMSHLARLEALRTGGLCAAVEAQCRAVVLADFIEDFVEEFDENPLIDPATDAQDYRSRLLTHIPADLTLAAAPRYLTHLLHDLIRNAIMYSMRGTPVTVSARKCNGGTSVQIDVSDRGYGVRASERERVFLPFERGRQPQILGEFGYGLSMYLCKQEVEAMRGQMWFESEEGVGSIFSVRLPTWARSSASNATPGR